MKPRIVIAVGANALAKWAERMQRALPEADVITRDAGRTTADAHATPADYALVWRPHPSFFAEQTRLKAVFNLGAGIDALAAMPEFPRSVPLIRLEDAGMAGPMAQYALAVVLRFAYRFDEYAHAQAGRRWAPRRPHAPGELDVGVLGMGAIGGVIARTMAEQGFRVRAYARTRHDLPGIRSYAGPSELPAFLTGVHVLINALPLTADTVGILRREHLERLADSGHLVNLARGAHLVEDDLLALLDAGKLSGATLDVFAQEPLPSEHRFWSHPGVTVTPHVSGVTLLDESVQQVTHKIRSLERDEPVTGVVDWKRGY
ncbi:MAG: glyoxylate/hydroxypyruvate reductase A [Burkholderiaceae bacterium]